MKQVRVWADVHSTGVFDEIGRYYSKNETTISGQIWDELQAWVKSYDYIIPLSIHERLSISDKIEQLDKEGIRLLLQIRQEWKNDIVTGEPHEFIYYSEGLMKNIDIS